MLTHVPKKTPVFELHGISNKTGQSLLELRAYQDDLEDDKNKDKEIPFVTVALNEKETRELIDNIETMMATNSGHLSDNVASGSYHLYANCFSFSEEIINISIETSVCSYQKLLGVLQNALSRFRAIRNANRLEEVTTKHGTVSIGNVSVLETDQGNKVELTTDISVVSGSQEAVMSLSLKDVDALITALINASSGVGEPTNFSHTVDTDKGMLLIAQDALTLSIKGDGQNGESNFVVSPGFYLQLLEKVRNARQRLENVQNQY